MKVNRTKLAVAMAGKKLTQARLAELAGVSKATVSSAKNGKSCADITVVRIAKALGVDVTEIIE